VTVEVLFDLQQRLARLEGALLKVARWGVIESVDLDAATVRVQLPSGLVVGPYRFQFSAGVWLPPEAGEQCLVICPGGDDAQGLALCGIATGGGAGDKYRVGPNATMKVALAPKVDAEFDKVALALSGVAGGGGALTGANTYTTPLSTAAAKTEAE
jgi:hypothetical protein